MKTPENRFEMRHLDKEDGGGFLVTFPDLPGCTADGDTPEEAIRNAAEAEQAWLSANAKWDGASKPTPAKLVARLPRSVHQDLQRLAKDEGVSINTMLVSLVSRGIGEMDGMREQAKR